MTYRIDCLRTKVAVVLSFQGLLDADALADLRTRIVAIAAPVRLLLCAGTEVEPGCIDALRCLPLTELSAESPFLTRWLSEDLS